MSWLHGMKPPVSRRRLRDVFVTPTVRQSLEHAQEKIKSQTDTPALDAQLLLSEILSRPRAWLLAHGQAEVPHDKWVEFSEAVNALVSGVALPYILGKWEFFGRTFRVTQDTLIPRPETEILVERALNLMQTAGGQGRVLEVGTGTGCIAISLALEYPDLQVFATDLSADALRIARWNSDYYHLKSQVQFIQADLLKPFSGPFQWVIANLPYIPHQRLSHLAVGAREPVLALNGGPEGLEVLNRLIVDLPRVLDRGGCGLLEIDPQQREALYRVVKRSLPRADIQVEQDLAGRDRVMVISRRGE